MTTTPHAAAAAAARQRLANVLATLQQNPNVPPAVLEILSGLARAMGPLFQLERGSADTQLFLTARGVLQETLEKIQHTDQNYPGVSDATGAVAECLGMIFNAMKSAGLVPAAAGAPEAQRPVSQPQQNPMPNLVAQPPVQRNVAPQPIAMSNAAFPAQQQPQPQMNAPAAQPNAMPQAQKSPNSGPVSPLRAPSGVMRAPTPPPASVPIGPNGIPRLESEIGVHSDTNFFTDFLGDISNHGGIFVATFHILPVTTPCEVLLTFPGNLTAEIRGIVRWKRDNAANASTSSSPGLGIEITQADAAAWDLIHRFIRKREPIMHEM